MVIGGLVTVDYAITIQDYKNLISDDFKQKDFTMKSTLQSFTNPPSRFDAKILSCLSRAVVCLQKKSQSMFIGSALFQGNLRTDLIFL